MHKLLLTGASGYIGGTILNELILVEDVELFALVRTKKQAEQVIAVGYAAGKSIRPVEFDLMNPAAVQTAVMDIGATIVIHTANAFSFVPAQAFIRGLAEVKRRSGTEVHFVHTSGAKVFSSHAGINMRLEDTQDVYHAQKVHKSPHPALQEAIDTCTLTHELGEELGVRTYILVPPMVYGPGEGFGNKLSIQFVAIVRIGLALKRVYQVADDTFNWPLCHLRDCVSLYMVLLKSIVDGSASYGKQGGYYFAENGLFNWKILYTSIAQSLTKLGKLDDASLVNPVSSADLDLMADVLRCPKEFVDVSVAGSCDLSGENGRRLGWKPVFDVDHLMSVVDEEVKFILSQGVV
ncbi:NAD(P)-binding protein [Fistulina hepatica ATCC 64428]|uniref:NAD(P)-binding protein n=1 Tax=Fistulina hepatica ATCC 64428 TaxID=1128425 RepID=A0A0D6ZZZ9_9AGAR|nr:NAD(P)-binding protein [Fistulina hepatica ATCC 64428]